MTSIAEAKVTWTTGDDLDKIFDKFSGDIVQAVQALKESRPDTTTTTNPELLTSLQALLAAFTSCAAYTAAAGNLKYPLTRAERQVRDVVSFLYPGVTLPPSSSHGRVIAINLDKKRAAEGEVQTFAVGPYRMPRLFSGLWQLSSPAWGSGSAESQEAALAQLVESGLLAADMADHYVCV